MFTPKLVLAAAVVFSGAAAANAGSVTPPPTVNIITPAASATDWGGFYAGLQGSASNGLSDAFLTGAYRFDLFTEGTTIGAFAGYNVQRGNLVFGGELAYAAGELSGTGHSMILDNHIDLKARVGYAAGRALFYGLAGYSTAAMEEQPGATIMPYSGMNYGVGVDFKVTDRFFLGMEYIRRDLAGDFDQAAFPGWTLEGPVDSITLRAGISF